MAWQFVRLKYRVTGRLLGGSAWSALGAMLIWLGSLGLGVSAGTLIGLAARLSGGNRVVAVLAGVAIQAAWVVVPVITSTLDTSINPRWFELLPLTPSQLSRGLLAAGMLGPGGLATFLTTAVGFAWGYPPGWWGALTVPAVALAMTYLGVVTGRLVTSLLSDVLARLDAAVVAPIVALGFAGVALWISSLGLEGDLAVTLPEWLVMLAAVPGGALGALAASLADGPWWVALMTGGWALATTVALVWGHGRALARIEIAGGASRPGRSRGTSAEVMGQSLVRLVPSSPVRVAAAKEGRYLRRDPRQRGQIVGGMVTVAVFGFIGTSFLPARFAPLLTVLVTWAAVSTLAPNQFGVEGGSMWAHVAAPTNLAALLQGKNLMWAAVITPLALSAAVVGWVMAGSPRLVLASLLLALAVGLVWLAVANITSVYGAFRYPEKNAFSSGPQTGGAIGVSLLGLVVSGALTVPMLVAAAVGYYFGETLGVTLAAAGSVLYGVVLFRAGFQWAQSAVVQRQFHLLDVLDRP